MKTLRLEVFAQTPTHYQLRFFESNNPLPKTRDISAKDLSDFIERSQQHYEKGSSLQTLGAELFTWLNGQESILDGYDKDTLLQILTAHDLENLAWELLHNGSYLCANQHKPFTPLRLVSKNSYSVKPANRPLRLLFMASSPENTKPVLQFEHEEGLILQTTRKSNLELIVEESGSLTGLEERISYGDDSDSFDVVHITGHAGFKDNKPVFSLEDDVGQEALATADDIASVFSQYGRFPRLLFLSGCKTAQDGTALPSLCEALVLAGLPAVLGWAKPVNDTVASFAAQKLYEHLANGVELGRAVALTRQALYSEEQKIQLDNPTYQPQWHYLRFYSDNTPLTALAIKGRPKPRREIRQAFLDKNAKTEVCPREDFVGRRRQLQQALRVLRSQQGDEHYAEGVLLLGMGGLGKSSLALRICQRLEQHLPQRFIWVGVIDETALRNVFSSELPQHAPAINDILNQQQDLIPRLQQLFNQFEAFHNALFVFDDFEQNFKDDYQHLEQSAYHIINALLSIIHREGSPSRVLITSRYEVTVPTPLRLTAIHLNSFRDSDLDKKTTALRAVYLKSTPEDTMSAQEKRAIELGAGNPRLLERLYQVLGCALLPHDEILENLASIQKEFREKLLLKNLLDYQSAATRQLIATLALFDIFMPKAVLDNPGLEQGLPAAIAVGLVEVYSARYFVSRLVVPLVADELDTEQKQSIYAKATECLYALWRQSDYKINSEETWELSRVAKLGEKKAIFSKVTGSLARRLHDLCRYDEAKALYDELLPIRKELGDKQGEGVTLNNISQIYHAKGDYGTALHYLTDSLKITQDIGDKQGEGVTLNNISQIYRAKGDYDTALRFLTDSLKISQDIGDKQSEGTTLNNLATNAHAKGDYDTALRFLTDSLKISQDIGDKKVEGTILNNISQIYRVKGDYDTALRFLTDSLKIQQDIGDKQGEGVTLNNISQIYDAKGDYDTALRFLTDSLKISQDIGDKQSEGATLNNISQIYKVKGDYDTALRFLTDSLKITQDIGDKKGEGTTFNNLATTAYAKGDYDTALRYLNDSLKISQDIGDKASECNALFNLGHITGERQLAMTTWLQAYKIAKQIGSAQTLAGLENLAKQLGGEGLAYWEALNQTNPPEE